MNFLIVSSTTDNIPIKHTVSLSVVISKLSCFKRTMGARDNLGNGLNGSTDRQTDRQRLMLTSNNGIFGY